MSRSAFIEKPPYWINRAAFAFRAELQQAFSDQGIEVTPEEWALQMVLFDREPLSVGELANLTLRDRTTVTRFVDSLERKGLILRQTDAGDRRRILVRLSPKARAHYPRMLRQVDHLIGRSIRGIKPAEIAITISVLMRMVDNLAKA